MKQNRSGNQSKWHRQHSGRIDPTLQTSPPEHHIQAFHSKATSTSHRAILPSEPSLVLFLSLMLIDLRRGLAGGVSIRRLRGKFPSFTKPDED